MSIITVNGIIKVEELGVVSPHEHVLLCSEKQFVEFEEVSKIYLSKQKVGIENIFQLSINPYLVKDNFLLDDPKVAEEELLEFKKAGGDTIVDATSIGIGRDPVAIRKISRALGLNIIIGCGYFTAYSQNAEIIEKSVDDITNEMISDIEIGICEANIKSDLIVDGAKGSNTGIRAGIIGEIGTSEVIYPFEKKVLIAAATVQNKTGLGMLVHTHPWAKKGLEALNILEKYGANLNKVVICHTDVKIDIKYCKEILKRGALIEFDDFGKEYIMEGKDLMFATDIERIETMLNFIEDGYISNILMSVDLCFKCLLHKYGGCGYDHILTNIVPVLIRRDLTMNQINVILKDNPARLLDTKYS